MRTGGRVKAWMLALALWAGIAHGAGASAAQAGAAGLPAADGADAAPALTAADAGGWLDGLVPWMLERNDVAGAAVAIVKDGNILLQRGYGHADVAAGTPIDPALTLFRPGSVTKLVTWTAVMQLVGQGLIDLDADINRYLDFQVPRNPAPGDPAVTMRHVLTHTTGFEDSIKGLMRAGFNPTEPLHETLRANVPRRLFEPGTVPGYSNYATGLAGLVVERLAGQPFDDYVEQHIFAPLGMRHSTMRQPLPERFRPLLAQGYHLASAAPRDYQMLVPAPSGSLAATAVDMARFMIAHLEGAAGRDSPILDAETAALMHAPQANHTPPLNTMALGFYQNGIGSDRVIGHGGDTLWFHTQLYLFLDHGVGLYVSLNSAGRNAAYDVIHRELFRGFSERYFPDSVRAPAAGAETDARAATERARLLASNAYRTSRRSESGPARLMGTLGQIRVTVNPDGTVSVPLPIGANGDPMRWREVSPWLWQRTDGPERLAAVVEDGRVVYWSVDPFAPFLVFQPVPAAQSAIWLMPALQLSLAWLAMTLFAWPVLALVRRRHGIPSGWTRRRLPIHRASRVGVALVLACWLGALMLMGYAAADYTRFSAALDGWIHALGALALLACTVGLAAIALNAWQAWASGTRWLDRAANAAVLIAAATACYAMWQSGLMGFPAHY